MIDLSKVPMLAERRAVADALERYDDISERESAATPRSDFGRETAFQERGRAVIREEVIGGCRLILGDCREILPTLGHVDAVVTDPPYGRNYVAAPAKVSTTGCWEPKHAPSDWDHEAPAPEIFDSILKCSKTQIIWGGNYFADRLPPTMQWLVWDKGQRGFSLADCEFAWTSQNKAARVFDYARAKAREECEKVHPTQKSIELMKWCIGLLPASALTILDPFMGSGTTGVACVKLGRRFIGIEIDPVYFEIACKRLKAATNQPDLFIEQPAPKSKQLDLMEAAE